VLGWHKRRIEQEIEDGSSVHVSLSSGLVFVSRGSM
jgi:hypothetical protein